jgi:hypothetical protein
MTIDGGARNARRIDDEAAADILRQPERALR